MFQKVVQIIFNEYNFFCKLFVNKIGPYKVCLCCFILCEVKKVWRDKWRFV